MLPPLERVPRTCLRGKERQLTATFDRPPARDRRTAMIVTPVLSSKVLTIFRHEGQAIPKGDHRPRDASKKKDCTLARARVVCGSFPGRPSVSSSTQSADSPLKCRYPEDLRGLAELATLSSRLKNPTVLLLPVTRACCRSRCNFGILLRRSAHQFWVRQVDNDSFEPLRTRNPSVLTHS